MPIDPAFWEGRRVLLTGHTGFKGAWLSLWLQRLGAEVIGLAHSAPAPPSLYEIAGVGERMHAEYAVDVRDRARVCEAVVDARPEVVAHLAAQPVVRRSLSDPVGTYEVNVMGTVNVLDAVRLQPGDVRAVLIVTSDKCYENSGGASGGGANGDGASSGGVGSLFREGDPLGGVDPYSSSKAAAEIVTAAYRRSFFAGAGTPNIASARAGNVIGGGDWGEGRLVPDAVRAVSDPAGAPLRVRRPQAIRPWQHVLNPLGGYLVLLQELWRSDAVASAWNFGPAAEEARTVRWVLERLGELWGGALRWEPLEGERFAEAERLALDSTHAARGLGWRPTWGLERGLEEVVRWHDAHRRGEEMRGFTTAQIERFTADTATATAR